MATTNPAAPFMALAARKRYAADRADERARTLRRQADELEGQAVATERKRRNATDLARIGPERRETRRNASA